MSDKFIQMLESVKPKSYLSEDAESLSKLVHKYENKDDDNAYTKVVTAKQYAREHRRFMKLKQKQKEKTLNKKDA